MLRNVMRTFHFACHNGKIGASILIGGERPRRAIMADGERGQKLAALLWFIAAATPRRDPGVK